MLREIRSTVLARRRDVSRTLIRAWGARAEAGEFEEELRRRTCCRPTRPGPQSSSGYDTPALDDRDAEVLARIKALAEEFEACRYRRLCTGLRHEGLVVNSKRVRRLMRREHDLQLRRRRGDTATTDSDHDEPLFASRAPGMTLDGPSQFWVADTTTIAAAGGCVDVAVIQEADPGVSSATPSAGPSMPGLQSQR